MLREKCNLDVTIDNLKRNKDGELTDIRITCKNNKPLIIGNYNINSVSAFEPFRLHIYKKGTEYVLDLDSNKVEYTEIILDEEDGLSFNAETLKTNKEVFNEVAEKFPVIIDGVPFSKKQLKKFDNSKIQSMSWNIDTNAKKRMTLLLSTKKESQIVISQRPQNYNNSLNQNKTVIIKDEQTKAKVITGNYVATEPLRLKTSVYDYATGTVIRPFSPSQYSTMEVSYKIYQNGETPNTKRTVYKDASGKILKVEDSDDVQLASNTNRFVTSNIVYVVDGDIVMEDNFKKIDPKDIESITILKDQKSKEKYAATNKEGVMIITTKAKKEVSLQQKRQALKARELAMKQRNEVVAERKEMEKQRKNEMEKLKQVRKDLKTVTSIFNDVKKIKNTEDENFKITSVKASITRKDGTKVELAEVY